jgi:hypothetical protein
MDSFVFLVGEVDCRLGNVRVYAFSFELILKTIHDVGIILQSSIPQLLQPLDLPLNFRLAQQLVQLGTGL